VYLLGTQPDYHTTDVLLYACNNNIAQKWPQQLPKHVGENLVNKIHHNTEVYFVGY
jgi:hypothetical protein